MLLMDELGDLSGNEALVIGRSNIVGKPMALLLLAGHRQRRRLVLGTAGLGRAKVPVDEWEVETLAMTLTLLAERRDVRDAMGRTARVRPRGARS
jgi:hypothetical protein